MVAADPTQALDSGAKRLADCVRNYCDVREVHETAQIDATQKAN